MIASIIYRSIVDYFSGLIPQDPTSKKNSLFKQYGMGTMKYLSVPKSDMSKHEDYNLGYFNAMKSNIEKINNEKRKDTENNTFKSIFEEVQNHENDAIDNDVEYIDKLLYHKSEMVKFNHLAKTLKFDVK